MSKTVPSSLLSDIQATVATLATCMRIRREDGIVYRVTNHDTDIVFGGETYDHKIPFTLSAISTTSQMNVDNADLSLFLDGETFKAADFENGAFGHAEVEIFLVDYTNPDHGRVILRQGWFGPIETTKTNVARVTIFGLLKALDFEVGRVYQPSCDADFGDKRCKIAVDFSQQRDARRPYRAGDWAYVFNTAAANPVTVVNHSFEDGSPIAMGADIPGWTKTNPNASFTTDPDDIPDSDPATDGTYILGTAEDTIDAPAEQSIYQDFDLREVGSIEFTDPAVEDDQITVSDGTIIATYTFKNTPTVAGEIAVGISAADCATSLHQAILDSNLNVEATLDTATVTIKNNLANGEIVEVVDTSSAIIVTDFVGAHGGIDPADIDLGVIFWAMFVDWAQNTYFLDPPGLRIEVMDAEDTIIDVIETGYTYLNELDAIVKEWRTGSLVFPLLATARKVRLYLLQYKGDGAFFNSVFDNVRGYWWDHSAGDPWGGVIQKVARIVSWDDNQRYLPVNQSFERDGAIANSNSTAITGWTRGSSADYWRVFNQFMTSPSATDGVSWLGGGDDSSGTQKTYQISQTITTAAWNLDTARIDLNKLVGRLRFNGLWIDDDSAISVVLDFLDDADSVINTVLALDFTTAPETAPTTRAYNQTFHVPALTRKFRLTLYARSPVGASLANAGFDNFRFYFIDGDRPQKTDPVLSTGNASTPFSDVPGTYTVDESLLWKAHTQHVSFDVVSTVLSQKEFFGTAITGADTAYTTALIRWISGDNKGSRNIIRVFDGDTQRVKLYFRCLHPIQPGDRFMYIRACQKEFIADCVLNFDNALNFRGFPYLPGRLSD